MIELLTVAVIVCVFVALLLPAVQSGREAARRTQCKNNLKQLSLALENYSTQNGTLPPGVVDPNSPVLSQPKGYHMSWIAQLLPHLEQSSIYRKIDFDHGAYDGENGWIRSTDFSVLRCPTSPYKVAQSTAGSRYTVRSNYAGCYNDTEAPIAHDGTGLLFLNSSIRYEEILDGSSNTILVGEKTIDPGELGWMSGTRSTLRNTGSKMTTGDSLPAAAGGGPGAPQDSDERYVGTFGSSHPHGPTFALADGAVRAIAYNVDPFVFRCLGNRADGEFIEGF